jgi:hypothetical protein
MGQVIFQSITNSTTVDVESSSVKFLGNLTLNLWDCGGYVYVLSRTSMAARCYIKLILGAYNTVIGSDRKLLWSIILLRSGAIFSSLLSY